MRKRTRFTLLAVFVVLCVLAAACWLRFKAPPEVARLMPESDAIVYLNVRPIRAATHFDRTPLAHSASYQKFIDATGVNFERDLDQVAFALHAMPNPDGPNGPIAFSEVFEGRFDAERLGRYLASLATRQETYAGRTIYAIPSENRTLRVAVLGYDLIAASNMPTPEQIHSILDRSRAAASPFSGSSLLAARFGDVPLFARDAWAIGRIGLPFAANGRISVLGLELPMPAEATFVASLHYTSALHLRIDEIAKDDAEAVQITQSLNSLLTLARNLQQVQQPTPRTPEDIAIRQFMDSLAIVQHKDRTTLTAIIPTDALKRFANPAPEGP